MKSNHSDEIIALEEQILEKQDMINETDSKMSMISVYVDQLEERLASFAIQQVSREWSWNYRLEY